MRVKMNTAMAGPKGTAGAGQVVDVDDATAAEWIKHGYASEAPAKHARADKAQAPAAETADQAPAETATATPQRRKK